MTRSLVEPNRCERIKKRAYLPNVDEYRSSSQALTDVALQDILAVTSSKSKTLKHGYIADLTCEGGISPCSPDAGAAVHTEAVPVSWYLYLISYPGLPPRLYLAAVEKSPRLRDKVWAGDLGTRLTYTYTWSIEAMLLP